MLNCQLYDSRLFIYLAMHWNRAVIQIYFNSRQQKIISFQTIHLFYNYQVIFDLFYKCESNICQFWNILYNILLKYFLYWWESFSAQKNLNAIRPIQNYRIFRRPTNLNLVLPPMKATKALLSNKAKVVHLMSIYKQPTANMYRRIALYWPHFPRYGQMHCAMWILMVSLSVSNAWDSLPIVPIWMGVNLLFAYVFDEFNSADWFAASHCKEIDWIAILSGSSSAARWKTTIDRCGENAKNLWCIRW